MNRGMSREGSLGGHKTSTGGRTKTFSLPRRRNFSVLTVSARLVISEDGGPLENCSSLRSRNFSHGAHSKSLVGHGHGAPYKKIKRSKGKEVAATPNSKCIGGTCPRHVNG